MVLDCGAFIGGFSLPVAKLGYRVHAIEPSPGHVRLIESVVRRNGLEGQLTVHLCGLGAERASLAYAGSLDGMIEILPNEPETVQPRVSVVPLDSLIFEPVKFMHVDVEGMELQVLRGAQRILRNHHPVVVFETHAESERPHSRSAELLTWMRRQQYELFEIPEVCGGRQDCRNILAWPNRLKWPGWEEVRRLDE